MPFSSRMSRILWRACVPLAAVAVGGGAYDNFNGNVLRRSARMFWTVAWVSAMYRYSDPQTAAEVEAIHTRAGEALLNVCLTNEGLYIKLGQGISTFNHVLPPPITDALRVLLDRAPTVPFDVVKRIVEEDVGKPLEECFETFDPAPIASASIAQVHRASLRLKDNSVVDVAVKVQKPSIAKQVWWDLQSYLMVCRFLQYVFDLPLMWSAAHTAEKLSRECDFRIEAENMERMRSMLQNAPDVYIPAVWGDILSKRVMVTEFVDAVKLVHVESVEKRYDTTALMSTFVQTMGEMIFVHGFVHCDPHPANLMVRDHPSIRNESVTKKNLVEDGGRQKVRPQLVLLDFGLCVDASASFQNSYARFFRAILLREYDEMQRITAGWGISDADLFVALTTQRPFRRGSTLLASITYDDTRRMQREIKAKISTLLREEELIPLEFVFVGRAMNILRAVNKMYHSPVNRIKMLTECAIEALYRERLTQNGNWREMIAVGRDRLRVRFWLALFDALYAVSVFLRWSGKYLPRGLTKHTASLGDVLESMEGPVMDLQISVND